MRILTLIVMFTFLSASTFGEAPQVKNSDQAEMDELAAGAAKDKKEADDSKWADATPGTFMLIDDPGVPCNGCWESNLIFTMDKVKGSTSFEAPLVDLNFGTQIGNQKLQLKIEFSYDVLHTNKVKSTGDDDPGTPASTVSGFRTLKIGIKAPIYENEEKRVALAVYPQIEVTIPGTNDKLGDKETTFSFPVLASKEFGPIALLGGRPIVVVGNVGYNHSFEDTKRDSVVAGFGAGIPLNDSIALMGEIYDVNLIFKDHGPRNTFYVNVAITKRFKRMPGLMVFAAVGHTIGQTADAGKTGHFIATVGVQYATPERKDPKDDPTIPVKKD